MALQLKRATASAWTTLNVILRSAEFGVEVDTNKIKLGNGVTPWNSLPYLTSGSSGTAAGSLFITTNPTLNAGIYTSVIHNLGTDDLTAITFRRLTTGSGTIGDYVELDVRKGSTNNEILIKSNIDFPAGALKIVIASGGPTGLSGSSGSGTATDEELRDRLTHTGKQPSTSISDFTEAVHDAVASLVVAGTNVTVLYDDVANTLTVSSAGGTGGTVDAEAVRDIIGTALVGIAPISIVVNDAADTITISTSATVNSSDAELRDRTTHVGEQAVSTITGLQLTLDAKLSTTDPSVTNARTPTAHASSHGPAASDDLTTALAASSAPVALAPTANAGAGTGFSRQGHVHPTTGLVRDTQPQTISGIKTFLASPIVPTPTTASQVVDKGYSDNQVAATPIIVQHTGTNPARPATTRPVIWVVPDANRPAINGTTAGGSYAAVDGLDFVWTF